MTTVLELLLVLGLMVLVHEFGHFAVAKWCGVRVETFAIGFGKRVVGVRRGGTDYQINALPLGGYVKMAGEIPGEEVSNDPGELNNHPRWQRMLIALAGPFANFVMAFVLMAGVYMVHNEVNEYISGAAVTDYISPGSAVAKTGIHSGDTIVHFDNVENPTWDDVYNHCLLNLNQTVAFSYLQDGKRVDSSFFVASKAATPDEFSPDTLGFVPRMQPTPVKVSSLMADSPAARAGLQPGDQIVRIDAVELHSVYALLAYMQDRKGAPAVIEVLRKGQTMLLNVTPELTDEGGTKAYLLGFHPVPPPVKVEQLSLVKSLGKSWDFTVQNSMLIKDVVKGMFEGHVSVRSLSGPIGIGQVVHEAAEAPGWTPLAGTVAMISINLGMVNLLPFPILDGGMIFLLLIEGCFRRDLPMQVKEYIFQAAFVCIVLFAAFIICNDIVKLHLPILAKLKL
ncbi:MAG: RIP metalloprotease RseP [Acidobacteriaceae bacterium]